MSRITKLLIMIVSILGMVQTIWLLGAVMPIDYLSKAVLVTIQTSESWILISVITISTILGIGWIMAMLLIVLAPKKADQLDFYSSHGKLTISKRAVEKSLQEAVMAGGLVTDVDAHVHLQRKNRVSKVKLSVVEKNNQDLVELGERLQAIVVNEMKNLMDVPVKKVKVKMKPYSEIANKQRGKPRVV